MRVPSGEADLLSIYFEEVAAHQYRQNQEMKKNANSSKGSRANEITDMEIGDEEDDD